MMHEIITKVNILDEIEKYAVVKTYGRRARCACPIHKGRNSSTLTISQDQGLFYCFNCGAGGNVFNFVKQVNSFDDDQTFLYFKENYDLESMPIFELKPEHAKYADFIKQHIFYMATKGQNKARAMDLLFELISKDFILESPNKSRIDKFIGYDKDIDTLTVSVFSDDDRVVQIKHRYKDGKKWVGAFGSEGGYVVNKATDTVFIGSGMAEMIIMELLDLPYIFIQSDSSISNIPEHNIKGKTVIVFEENDGNFRSKVTNKLLDKKPLCLIGIDFECILDKTLPKGYDLRDFVNEINDFKKIKTLIQNEISFWLREGGMHGLAKCS